MEVQVKSACHEPYSRYFVVKCLSMNHLKTCQRTLTWACSDRKHPPQPKDILTEAFHTCQQVVLIFSVNNCHGWHGYATMETTPGCGTNAADVTKERQRNSSHGEDVEQSVLEGIWYPFKIKWRKLFLDEFGEQCLSSGFTESLYISNKQSVNKARNFDELPCDVGSRVCRLIDDRYSELVEEKFRKTQDKINQRPKPFLDVKDTGSSPSVEDMWAVIVKKVEQLGKVLLACPFGSQRYNLHTEESDTDMFVVYAADTESMLGFTPPPHTIKNQDTEMCDYTIHEVHRFCQLLMNGDPRCVETLFLDPAAVHYVSEEWRILCEHRNMFLTKLCMEKYMRDALGARGLKQLEKLHQGTTRKGEDKLNKLFYIVLRLLQNARNIALGEELMLFRPNGSQQRELLISVRNGKYSFMEMKSMADEIVADIESHDLPEPEDSKIKNLLEKWMLDIRYRNFVSKYTLDSS